MKIAVPENVIELCRILRGNGYEAFVVGGGVRDSIMGIKPQDHDITTNALPGEVTEIFRAAGFPVIPTGVKHGTVSVMAGGLPYEVTTYRKDGEYPDGRHPAEVSFVPDLLKDLDRRDLTINAMAYDPLADHVVDLFGGESDLEHGIIRAVGDPVKRFSEDHLRMLRAVRYSARFGFRVEEKTMDAIKRLAGNIVKVSAERILGELVKMASETGEDFASAVALLRETGLLEHILPEVYIMDRFEHDADTHPEGDLWEHTLAALRKNPAKDPFLNLAILLHDVGKTVTRSMADGRVHYHEHHETGKQLIGEIARRLKMSADMREALEFVAFNHMKFRSFTDMSNHKIVGLIMDKNWELLYSASRCDDLSRMGLYDREHWEKIDERVSGLRKQYVEQKKMEAIRRIVNGELVMRVKNIGPGPVLGKYIQDTVEWVLNAGVDVSDVGRIEEYVRGLP
jgi:tRNA nucleotidyltransferase (CCA-adding enzyme)